jgi:hypothetical protein
MPLRQTIGISLALLMVSAGAMAKSSDKSTPLIRRASLSFLLMLIIASVHAQCPPPGGITIDNVNNGNFGYYNGDVGPYWSDLNVWDPPTDSSSYSTAITNCPSTYPNGTVMSWSFPGYLNGTSNIYAYPDIVYGILGGGYPPTPANIPTPIQLGSLPSDFSLTYNITLNANPDDQDVLIETWPTTVPNPPNLSTNDTRTNEIGFMAHVPSYTLEYLLSFPNHIDYSANNFNAYIVTVPYTPPFTVMIPVTTPGGTTPVDMTSGTYTIPFGALLNFLTTQGILNPNNYITGYQFGFEIGRGTGSVTINQLEWHWNY